MSLRVEQHALDKSWGLGFGHGAKHQLSVIVPIFNESGNIAPLFDRLFSVLEGMHGKSPRQFEVIAINDGSEDGSLGELRAEAARRPQLKIVDFRRNFGQTAALMAGINLASGQIVVSIDADLQNAPEDIPRLLEKIGEGFDVVSGWRKDRKDAKLRRIFVSRVANRLISAISGVRLHDYGCTLKAYRRDVIKGVRLYGEMHRFLPIYATWMGAKVVELPVQHYPRTAGKSKYGLSRVIKVLLDVFVVTFLDRYMIKPIYVFGGFGILSILLAFAVLGTSVFLKFVERISMISTPLPLLSAMAFLIGCMSILLGLLAEIVVRTYFESQRRPPYAVRELVNFESDD
jgi:dolichol-phosphate mannosyltransferase